MHYCLEIIIPSMERDQIAETIEHILDPFSEYNEDPHATTFFDWYVIGGRWNGTKAQQFISKERIDEFYAKLNEMKVTVSSVIAGKQHLSDEFVEPVNELWKEMFADTPFNHCPIFDNWESRYTDALDYPGNVMKLGDLHPDTSCARVILAGPEQRWNHETHESENTGDLLRQH